MFAPERRGMNVGTRRSGFVGSTSVGVVCLYRRPQSTRPPDVYPCRKPWFVGIGSTVIGAETADFAGNVVQLEEEGHAGGPQTDHAPRGRPFVMFPWNGERTRIAVSNVWIFVDKSRIGHDYSHSAGVNERARGVAAPTLGSPFPVDEWLRDFLSLPAR